MRKYIKIRKIEDTRFNGQHPNNINEGYTAEGWLVGEISDGMGVVIATSDYKIFNTSRVKKIESNRFYTENSVYEYEIQSQLTKIMKCVQQKAQFGLSGDFDDNYYIDLKSLESILEMQL